MTYKKVVAVVRRSRLSEIERRLQDEGIQGLTVSPVKGYGEYADTFGRDLLVPHVRLEVFAVEKVVETIVRVLLDAGHTGEPGDGLVTVAPVERIMRIRTKKEPESGDL